MPEENYTHAPHSGLMQIDEIEQLAKIFVNNGITKVRLTGGEPLVRKDAAAVIKVLSRLPVALSMTTNGIRIDDILPHIIDAKFSSINVSLDTLQPEKFIQITHRNYFDRVWKNINLLLENQIRTKLNVVVMKGLNDDEILDFVELTKTMPVEVRFIEFMPFSGNRWTSNQVFTYNEMLNKINTAYSIQPLQPKINDTTKPYSVAGHKGSIAVISTMSAPFCAGCNRLRLTADGKLKNCLFSTAETDLLTTLRQDGDVLSLIQKNIRAKAKALGGQWTENFEQINPDTLKNRSMIIIGG
jgi:cyclic pyranopterin phosphate synthase